MAPKVVGSWNLLEATDEKSLDFFVMFSSAVSVLGSAGQASHAAACAFQDSLAAYGARRGRRVISINWGPWADIGSVARHNVGERLSRRGLFPIDPQRGVEMFAAMLRDGRPQQLAIDADWTSYLASNATGAPAPLWKRLHRPAPANGQPQQNDTWAVVDLAALPPAERKARLRTIVYEQLSAVVGLTPGLVPDPDQGLRDLGVDSLMSLELKNRLQVVIGCSLPSTLVFDYPTPAALVEFLSGLTEPRPTAASNIDDTQSSDLEALSHLTEQQAEALLIEELRYARTSDVH
jgi:acyl carrier protein